MLRASSPARGDGGGGGGGGGLRVVVVIVGDGVEERV